MAAGGALQTVKNSLPLLIRELASLSRSQPQKSRRHRNHTPARCPPSSGPRRGRPFGRSLSPFRTINVLDPLCYMRAASDLIRPLAPRYLLMVSVRFF